VIEHKLPTFEEKVDDLRHSRRTEWLRAQQDSLPNEAWGSPCEVSEQSFFQEFFERLRGVRGSNGATPKENTLTESIATISRFVGVRIPCDDPSTLLDKSSMVTAVPAARLALLSLCQPNTSGERAEQVLSLLVQKYIRSDDLNLFTGEMILHEAKQFFASTGERKISFEEVVKALLVATLVRLKDRSLSEWDQVVEVVTSRFPDALIEHLLSFQGSYLNEQDLIDLDIPSEKHQIILDSVKRGQLFGKINSRRSALREALCSARSDKSNHEGQLHGALGALSVPEKLLTRSGSDSAAFVNRDTADVFYPQQPSRATYALFRCISKEQFPPRILGEEVSFELRHSENYPAIARELQFAKLSEVDVIERMRVGAIRNLPELEEFSESLEWRRRNLPHASSVSLNQLEWITSSKAVFAEVRVPDEHGKVRSITLGLGYQGANHEGTGVVHVIKQRPSDSVFRKFIKDGEDIDTAVERFIRDGVLYCAGEGTLRIPSRLSPDTHTILFSHIRGTEDQFISLVLGRASREGDVQDATIDANYMVTALFHKNSATLRQSLKRELSGWAENQSLNERLDQAILAEYLGQVHQFLDQFMISPISLAEVRPMILLDDDQIHTLSASSSDEPDSLWDNTVDGDDYIERFSSESVADHLMSEDLDSEDGVPVEVPGLSFAVIASGTTGRASKGSNELTS
jgi:hypothetical protein